jgi:hypothetical protein
MSLIKKPIEKIDDEKKKQVFLDITIARLSTALAGMTTARNALFREIWANRDGLTPQQCFDAIGVDGDTLIKASLLSVQITALLDPGAELKIPPAPYEYVVNADGTVTVGALKEPK